MCWLRSVDRARSETPLRFRIYLEKTGPDESCPKLLSNLQNALFRLRATLGCLCSFRQKTHTNVRFHEIRGYGLNLFATTSRQAKTLRAEEE